LGEKSLALTSLDNPRIDWVALAQGYGVRACRVGQVQALETALREGFAQSGPLLIEMTL
jgi:acetolactate synthase-1/2/3 large subunit